MVTYIYIGLRLGNPEKNIIPEAELGYFDYGVNDTKNPCVEELFMWVILNTIGILFGTIKLMFFMRVNEQFVLIVELIFRVVQDIGRFLLFFALFIVLISLLFRISGVIVGMDDYPDINSYFAYSVQMFRNGFGDLATPDVSYWENKKLEGPWISTANKYYGWFLWVLNIFVNLIVLLNFLIAII